MNLLWFIQYLRIAFECPLGILETIWLLSDRLQQELDLILVPLDAQLQEWEYTKHPRDDAFPGHMWQGNPRLGPRASIWTFEQFTDEQIVVLLNGDLSRSFVIFIDDPKNEYRLYSSSDPVKIYNNRNSWMEELLHQFYQTPLGPEKPTTTSLKLGRWIRTATGIWLCTV